MAGYVNELFMMGEVRDHPEFITNENGDFCKFTLETKNEWKDAVTGNMECRMEYFPVFVVNPSIVTFIRNYIKRGHFVYLKGVVQSRKYFTESGAERFALQILIAKAKGQLLYVGSPKKKADDSMDSQSSNHMEIESNSSTVEDKKGNVLTDDIPF